MKDGQAVTLCNACGILYKRHWFCTLCTRIYRKETASASDGWLSCDYCEGWAHLRWYVRASACPLRRKARSGSPT